MHLYWSKKYMNLNDLKNKKIGHFGILGDAKIKLGGLLFNPTWLDIFSITVEAQSSTPLNVTILMSFEKYIFIVV